MKPFFILIFLTFVFNPANAESPEVERKINAIVLTVMDDRPTSYYETNLSDIPGHQSLIVSVDDFRDYIALRFNLTEAILLHAKSPLEDKIQKMMKLNNLHEDSSSYQALYSSERAIIKIVYLMEFIERLSHRSDLNIFNQSTVRNLIDAIIERVESLYVMAEKFWLTIPEAIGVIELQKKNFINIGLEFEKLFPVNDPWIDRFIRTSGAEQHYPIVLVSQLLDLYKKQTDLKFNQWHRRNLCVSLFAI